MSITERIDSVTKIPENYLNTVLPAPKSVKIELTGRCNYRCGFCALRTREHQPKDDMDFDFFCRIAKEMREAGVEELGMFYLGESCMNPSLLERAIRYAKVDLGFPYVFLTTNGSLLTEKVAKAVMASGLDSLKFSVNAADREQFAKVMGISERWFDVALDNIATARRMRDQGNYKCGIYASSIQYDGEQQEKMEKLLADRVLPFVDQHYWLPLYGEMTRWNEDRKAQLGFTPTAGNQGRLEALRDPLPCWSLFTEGHVRADGCLSACCFDSDGRFQMGNLYEQSFMDAWNSQAFQQLRKAHLNKDVTGTVCQGCLAYN